VVQLKLKSSGTVETEIVYFKTKSGGTVETETRGTVETGIVVQLTPKYSVWYIILIIIILVIVINYIKRKISHSFENTSKKRFFKGKAVKKPSKTETTE